MIKRPLIIDCDPGIDDAECLMMVQGSGQFDIRGITAVHGNVPLELTSKNALFLSKLYGIDCPVYLGAKDVTEMLDVENAVVNLAGIDGVAGEDYTINVVCANGDVYTVDFTYATLAIDEATDKTTAKSYDGKTLVGPDWKNIPDNVKKYLKRDGNGKVTYIGG